MLRIGLTGGIGAGKSTVAATFAECGGIVVDGDLIAREVVRPGTEGLRALVDAFGAGIVLPDGALDRPTLAALAFGSDERRAVLNGIVHPLVGRRRAELIAQVGEDQVAVEDIPLLVEAGMAAYFPLVVVVHADVDLRVQRLVEHRGMARADALARIAAQAGEEQRRAAADVWLDNSGSPAELAERARTLWHDRIVPFADNLRTGSTPAARPELSPADPTWPAQAERIIARLAAACGSAAVRIDHIGSTAIAGLPAKDVIDIQVTVASLAAADEVAEAIAGAGYPRRDAITLDAGKPDARSTVAGFDHTDNAQLWHKRFHRGADPARPTHVHLRVDGWPGQQFALLFVDWLRADSQARSDYLAAKVAAAATPDYAEAKERWFAEAYHRAWAWADASQWRPSGADELD